MCRSTWWSGWCTFLYSFSLLIELPMSCPWTAFLFSCWVPEQPFYSCLASLTNRAISSGRASVLNTIRQQKLLHNWIIKISVQTCIVIFVAKERESSLDLWCRTMNLRRPERARNEGCTGPQNVFKLNTDPDAISSGVVFKLNNLAKENYYT